MSACIQIIIGANITIVVLCLIGSGMAIAGFILLGESRFSAWVVLFFGVGNFIISIIAKTILLQPLNSNLVAPVDAFLIATIAMVGVFFAGLFSSQIKFKRVVFRTEQDQGRLKFIANTTFIIGFIFWGLNFFIAHNGKGFGGLIIFDDLIYMGIIAETARLCLRGDRSILANWRVLVMILISVILAILHNRKLNLVLGLLAYFTTTYFFTKRISIKQLVALGIIWYASLIIFIPAIQIMRIHSIQKVSISRKFDLIESYFSQLTLSGVKSINHDAYRQFRGGYYDYFNDYKLQPILGRFVSVQQIGPVAFAVNNEGIVGSRFLLGDLAHLSPAFLLPNKPEYGAEYYTLLHYGILSTSSGKYPTVPIAAEAYSAYGFGGVLLIVFVTFITIFIVISVFSRDLNGNIYSIFFMVELPFVFAHQQNFGQLWGFILRNLPLLLMFFIIINLYLNSRRNRKLFLSIHSG